MHKFLSHSAAGIGLTLFFLNTSYAVDSYRYVHVSIDTIWWIFLGLLTVVLSPFILMGALVWHSARRKAAQDLQAEAIAESEK
ncbi:MAG: hypothetical protein V4443_03725 [Pseudomonadota bacterium]